MENNLQTINCSRISCLIGRIICTSFSTKAELELLTNVTYDDYVDFMNDIWQPLLAADLRFERCQSIFVQLIYIYFGIKIKKSCGSFVVKDDEEKVLAVSLNFDVFNEPTVSPRSPSLAYVFDFLESVEAPVRFATIASFLRYLFRSVC